MTQFPVTLTRSRNAPLVALGDANISKGIRLAYADAAAPNVIAWANYATAVNQPRKREAEIQEF